MVGVTGLKAVGAGNVLLLRGAELRVDEVLIIGMDVIVARRGLLRELALTGPPADSGSLRFRSNSIGAG